MFTAFFNFFGHALRVFLTMFSHFRNFIRTNAFSLVLFTLVIAYLVWQRLPLYQNDDRIIGSYINDFKLSGLTKGQPSLSRQDLRGKKALLYFFATWCGPCHLQRPFVNQVHQNVRDENFIFAAVSAEDAKRLRDYQKENGLGYPVFTDTDSSLHQQLGVQSYPTMIWINKEGRIEDISRGLSVFLLYSVRHWVTGSLF